jgi:High potential iron-sulfur protein
MNVTRRRVIKNLSLAAGLSAGLTWRPVLCAEAPRLDVKDPAAAALGYVENVTQVDAKKYPEFVPGSSCENCLQLQGTAGNNYRPCGLFPGKLVSVAGWCKSWTPEM